MGTAGCEPQPRACDCCRRTAYWSTLPGDGNHSRQTVLIRPEIVMILSFDRAQFVTGNTSSPLLQHSRWQPVLLFLFLSWLLLPPQNSTALRDLICDLPRVWDMIQNAVNLTESGIFLSMCDSASPAQCIGIGSCQLLVSRHECLSAGCQQVS